MKYKNLFFLLLAVFFSKHVISQVIWFHVRLCYVLFFVNPTERVLQNYRVRCTVFNLQLQLKINFLNCMNNTDICAGGLTLHAIVSECIDPHGSGVYSHVLPNSIKVSSIISSFINVTSERPFPLL